MSHVGPALLFVSVLAKRKNFSTTFTFPPPESKEKASNSIPPRPPPKPKSSHLCDRKVPNSICKGPVTLFSFGMRDLVRYVRKRSLTFFYQLLLIFVLRPLHLIAFFQCTRSVQFCRTHRVDEQDNDDQ